MTAKWRTGFTLVELLVVIAIIGMLVGMLLPAVQQAREAARQTQCNNHLRQLAVACLNYESQQGTYPSGGWWQNWCGDPDRGFGVAQPGSWMFSILPYLEQNALYQLTADGNPDNAQNSALVTQMRQTILPMLYCPSRRPPRLYSNLAKNDYVGCSGDVSARRNTDPNAGSPTSLSSAMEIIRSGKWRPNNNNGTIYSISTVSNAEIYDGTTNTYLVGEKYLDPDGYEKSDPSDDTGLYTGSDMDSLRCTRVDSWKYMQDRSGVHSGSEAFGSVHSGGGGFAMGDGSVRRVGYDIDESVHRCLGVRNDGEVVRIPE
ncbi:MAG: DUF1559 domain-containing protein [Planctomycetia bacterium]|nr:DUF1559 domain-containing protein [Planctomycetia bacterium]